MAVYERQGADLVKAESFTDVLRAYGERHPPEMQYQKEEDFAQWQAEFRAKLSELRGPLPQRAALDVQLVESVDERDHTRHVLHIPVSPFSTLVAYLLVPHDLSRGEKRPGLIVSHGHAAYGIDSVCGVRGTEDADGRRRAYALHAVRSGYVVLAPAWWGWVGRDGHLGLVGRRDKCNVIQMAASMYGLNVLSLHIQDGQAAVDVLASRPEVDAMRIGCIGNSYGGRTTMWLAIYDDRIAACVASGCMNTFRERSLRLSSCGIQYLPGLLQYGDVPELLSTIAPRPMQLQAGEGDRLITPSDRDMIERTVRAAYARLGAEGNLDYVLHEEGHLLLWEPARDFFERNL
jgi:dienelactone hydrolase